MRDLIELELAIVEFDDRLRPIAERPVDLKDPNWKALFKRGPHPLDDAGIRAPTEKLLDELITEYETSDDTTRTKIRRMFATYTSFAWAAVLSTPPTTEVEFRRQLILFSMRDQGRDSRDAIRALQDLCQKARAADIDVEPILWDVASLSSDENKYGMGSTRHQLNSI